MLYRWHVLDPVRFSESLKVTMEHKGNAPLSEDAWYLERPDFFSSVALWYQTGEPAPWEPLPGYPERCVPWKNHHLLRAFRQVKTTGNARVRISTTGMFGGRPVLAIENASPGDAILIPFTVEGEGKHSLRLMGFPGEGEGDFLATIDAMPTLAPITFRPNGFHHGYNTPDICLGTFLLAPGEHTLTLTAQEGATSLGVELLRTLKLPPPAVREVKTHNEAHFIRIGIGRAVYAHRLAFDTLPESLKALHELELLDERYLADENGHPLESALDSDTFSVKSTAPNGWTYSWKGLDARR
ncbi:MAG: DUF2961 domain-containing protein [Armatimonas sp.]